MAETTTVAAWAGEGRAIPRLPGGRDEYYTKGDHATAAVWLGSAASRLDIDGAVDPEPFRRLLDAKDPTSGEPLGVPRTTARRLAGFDLCFSAPKSVSVAWALASSDVAERVAAAHDRAVSRVMEVFEAEVVRARRGARAATQIETTGIVAAAFGHRTSRAGDPQVHSHVVVPNLTMDSDGRWSALAGDRIYRWAKTLGYLYQSELRHELTTTLGMRWGPVRKGAAELQTVHPDLIEAFSKRRAQITAALESVGGVSRSASQTATLATRSAKSTVEDLDTLRRSWLAQARQLGAHLDLASGPSTPRTADTPDGRELKALLLGPDGLTINSSSFDRRDVLQALASAHQQGAPAVALRGHADGILADSAVVALASRTPAGQRYSTRELLDLENRLLHRVIQRNQAALAIANPAELDRLLAANRSLSEEQRRMMTSLTTSGAGVEVVVGRAGAGKTYALDTARAAWEASGYTVIGTALAARPAAELQAGAGIPSATVDRLLADLHQPRPLSGLAPGTVVVVDEAGMIGTRKLARLLDHADARGAKVVLVGDHRQLPEIEAGGAFAAVARVVPTTELTENRRQAQAWERDALAQLRSGSVAAAVDAYTDAGRLTLAADAERARQTMVADWWQAHQAGERTAMFALRRVDVEDLNRRARHLLDQAGLLGPERIEIAGREFAVGDRVQCLRNDRRLGVRNGTLATIEAFRHDAREITLDNGTLLPARYLDAGHLAHAYATTVHKAQGATFDRSFLLGSDGLYREAGYVGLSRARHTTQLYIVAPPARDPDVDPIVETIRALSNSKAQTLATDQLHPPRQQTPEPASPQRQALLADPPPWLTGTLGPPPLDGPARDRWARTAERIAAYRDVYAVDGTTDPLGSRPDQPEQRRAWELARLTVRQHQRALELDHGLQL